jgi:hypothetical protein
VDRFWIKVKDKSRIVVPVISMSRGPRDNAVEFQGGNIVIPHKAGRLSIKNLVSGAIEPERIFLPIILKDTSRPTLLLTGKLSENGGTGLHRHS